MGKSNDDLAVAFALTAGAGMSTALGAACVFFPQTHNRFFLGGSLAFAAGVMIYVSLVEIMVKSEDEMAVHFDERDGVNRSAVSIEDYEPSGDAKHCTQALFFAGVLFTFLTDILIKKLKGGDTAGTQLLFARHHEAPIVEFDDEAGESGSSLEKRTESYTVAQQQPQDGGEAAPAPGGATANASGAELSEDEEASLLKTALITGVAIAVHNFPEGLATFLAAAEDPEVGASLAIAIGVHNIPEGICVAVPIYFATGSKWRAFFWGTMSGVAEVFAGAIGWIAFASSDSDLGPLSYGVLFGVVGGMMVYICIKELLPTAFKYDPEDRFATACVFAGAVVMAASLSLFVA